MVAQPVPAATLGAGLPATGAAAPCHFKRTAFAQAQVNTIRLKLLKIGAVMTRNTRTIRLMPSSQYPDQDLFLTLASKLVLG